MINQVKNRNKANIHYAVLLCLFLLIYITSHAQIKERNLVPNPSFEKYKGKNPKPSIISAKPWLNVGTVDFFIKTDVKDTSVFKGPHSGKCYVGMRFQVKYKEYAYVKLLEPLKKGRVYYFSMYVRLLDVSTVSMKQLGVYFSDSPFKMGMIFNSEGLIDTTYKGGLAGGFGWMPITGKYVARGKEQYLIIGNFTTKTKDDFVKKNKWNIFELKEAFYYLDDVALMDTSYVPPPKINDSVYKDTTVTAHKIVEVKTVYFENSKYDLQKKSVTIMEQVVALSEGNPSMEIEIKGYADNQGAEPLNVQLSKERALSVYEYLKKKGLVNPMTYQGYGSSDPIAPNDTPENRAKNRRVEIHLIKKF
jgi:OmpA-OmpF porin, OOP family